MCILRAGMVPFASFAASRRGYEESKSHAWNGSLGSRRHRRLPRRLSVSAAVACLAWGLSACGGGSDTPTLVAVGDTIIVTESNQVASFNRATPGTQIGTRAIIGLQAGETVSGIDFRPASGLLYALGSRGNLYNEHDKMPLFDVTEFEGGLLIGARRNADAGRYYWRITPWIMPWFTIIPPRAGHPLGAHAWVPIDDENCWAWSINYHPKRALSVQEVAAKVGYKLINNALRWVD